MSENKGGSNWIALVLALCFGAFYVTQCSSTARERKADESNSPNTVTYRVEGDTPVASITYSDGRGGTSQQTISLPWSKDFQMTSGSDMYLSAQNQKDFGNLTVHITIAGKHVRSAQASGGYAVASITGRCCTAK